MNLEARRSLLGLDQAIEAFGRESRVIHRKTSQCFPDKPVEEPPKVPQFSERDQVNGLKALSMRALNPLSDLSLLAFDSIGQRQERMAVSHSIQAERESSEEETLIDESTEGDEAPSFSESERDCDDAPSDKDEDNEDMESTTSSDYEVDESSSEFSDDKYEAGATLAKRYEGSFEPSKNPREPSKEDSKTYTLLGSGMLLDESKNLRHLYEASKECMPASLTCWFPELVHQVSDSKELQHDETDPCQRVGVG